MGWLRNWGWCVLEALDPSVTVIRIIDLQTIITKTYNNNNNNNFGSNYDLLVLSEYETAWPKLAIWVWTPVRRRVCGASTCSFRKLSASRIFHPPFFYFFLFSRLGYLIGSSLGQSHRKDHSCTS